MKWHSFWSGIVAMGIVVLSEVGSIAAEIRNVTAAYGWPWGVGLCYEVVGFIPTNAELVVTAVDLDGNITYRADSKTLSGDTGCDEGEHHVLWNMDMQGLKLQSTNVVFAVEYWPLYFVIDLSAGASSSSYPVTWLDAPPSGGFNTNMYKTTALVLRRIEAGTFYMGSPTNELGRSSDEYRHPVTLTKPFYMGLFEVTQWQWNMVMGSNPAAYSGSMRPVENVSYSMIRGTGVGTNWPSSNAVDTNSFLGKLRAKTGLVFDLPTEAQWEYACRAGAGTALNNYRNLTGRDSCPNMDQVGRYNANRWHVAEGPGYTTYHTTVGSYMPNSWGLYDMHGNVCEWCLDWIETYGEEAVTNPKGASAGTSRAYRGGWFSHSASLCRAACRFSGSPSITSGGIGFRLACFGGL